jgi:beta-N-acetylhexosaminidase
VLDVDSNGANPIIGDRAFGGEPAAAAACALAFAAGLGDEGVCACGKHFPGHGDASADSHVELPVIPADLATLLRRELVPFAAAAAAGIPMIMTAHCLYPALDPDVPATLSPAVVRGLLRERLGYDGVVVTDDLGMKAIADRFAPADVLRRGLDAGVDLFLHCGAAGEGLALAAELSRGLAAATLPADRALAAAARVRRLREGLAGSPRPAGVNPAT